jgi:ribosome-associated toxin RatA of RatAB toxin-antitoxin module
MRHTASHSVTCNATADRVYDLIRQTRDWPQVLEPCEAVTVLEEGENFEHVEISARVNGELMTWRSRRRLLPEVFGVEATIDEPMKLVEAMRTNWRVVELNAEQSVVILEHEYDLSADVVGQVAGVSTADEAARFIESAIDRNSAVELGNIKAAAERAVAASSGRDFHLRHSVVCAAQPDIVYDMIRSTETWPRIFDACLSAAPVSSDETGELVRIEAIQDGQQVSWDTRRRYFDEIRRVDYHLPIPMPFLESMQGQWRVVPLGADRCLLTVDRSWRILPDVTGIRAGVDTVAQAAALVRGFVDRNAQAEMDAIKAFVEDKTDTFTSVTSRFPMSFPPDQVFAALADVSAWSETNVLSRSSLDVLYDDRQHQEFIVRADAPHGVKHIRVVRRRDAETLTVDDFLPEPPAVLQRDQASWQVHGDGAGSVLIAKRRVVLDSQAGAKAFGTDDLRAQKAQIREILEAQNRMVAEGCARWLGGPPIGKSDGRG